MLSDRKIGLGVFVFVALVVGLCLGVLTVERLIGMPELRKAELVLSIAPQTAEEARPDCPIPLPDAARNVQFAVWSFGEVIQSWTRFEAPVSECLNHAEAMVEPFKKLEGYAVSTTPIPEDTGVLCVLDPTEVNLSWFADCQSADGPVFRVTGGRAPVIWVDTNNGIFYCEVKNECHSLSPP